MKYCPYCGKELMDAAVICVGCGCAVGTPPPAAAPMPTQPYYATAQAPQQLLQKLSQRVQIDGIIWLVIGILQVLSGLSASALLSFLGFDGIAWTLLIVGVLNIVAAAQDLKYSKAVLLDPRDIVPKFEPLVGPIITLIYNLLIGGLIGVAGSIYYFIAVRGFVMDNRAAFDAMGRGQSI